MQMLKRLFPLALMLCWMAGVAPASAHPGHAHKILGQVTMVAPDHVMVKTVDTKTKQETVVTIAIDDKTKVVRGATAAALADVTVGARVVVDVGTGKEPLTAREIKLSPAPPTKKTQAQRPPS